MDHFAGLDVSVKETGVCIVNDTGRIVKEVKVASEPEALLLKVLGNPAYRFERIGSGWLTYPIHPCIARLNRANRAGQPMFFASRGAAPVLYELRAKAGDRIALSGWKLSLRNLPARLSGVARQLGGCQAVSSPEVDECGE
jgi:hypothetical protein